MKPAFILALALAASSATAKPPMQPKESGELRSRLPEGATVEARVGDDLTGDGLRDLAVVGGTEEERMLIVFAAFSSETDMGYRPIGSMAMDISPLGSATLSFKKGVLIVEDLTGGTTAVSSRYRFRYDKAADRMRLIGDDVTLYSRTNMHGSTDISTNRLTGVQITKRSEIKGTGENASLVPGKPVTRKISNKPIYMEDAPDPAVTVGLED